MNMRTIQFWAIYNSVTKKIIGCAKTKKALRNRWGDLKESPWCVVVRMKGHYLPPRKHRIDSGKAHG